MAYAGWCYLVAQEHVRGLAPDEIFATKPIVQEKLEAVREAQQARDYVDLSAQEPSAEDLARAAALPAGDAHLPGGMPAQELLPEHPVERGEEDPGTAPAEARREAGGGWIEEGSAEAPRWSRKKRGGAGTPGSSSESVDERPAAQHRRLMGPGRSPQKGGAAAAEVAVAPAGLVPVGGRAARPSTSAGAVAATAALFEPGASTGPRSRSPRGAYAVFQVRQTGVMTEKLKKKLLDREVPYSQIPPGERELSLRGSKRVG